MTGLRSILILCTFVVCGAPHAAEAQNAGAQMPNAEDSRRQMMRQLGITALIPGRSAQADGSNPANYEECRANPYPDLPAPLRTFAGTSVVTPVLWWSVRRPELAETFSREIYGQIPAKAPSVSWRVTATERAMILDRPVVVKRLLGRADNGPYPQVNVEIRMVVVTPADAGKPVPLLVMLTRGADFPTPAERDARGDLPREHQLIEGGWGYAVLDTDSIQPDNGADLMRGVIGLSSRGQPRRPEDWGVLRAWAWGASRAYDYLSSDPAIDRARIGVEGVSRYGKAALVTMAFDQRFAVGLIASSGKGGTTLFRRDFGEAVANLSQGAPYWMAGNFMRYGEDRPGAKTPGDLPVDSHQLIAMAAPRPIFISVGVPEKGDALWIDQQGTFMATVEASRVYEFLGERGLTPRPAGYAMPPVNTDLLGGRIAWRQHDGGHTDRPNIPHFIRWANEQLSKVASPEKSRA